MSHSPVKSKTSPCRFDGCGRVTLNVTGYCADHVHRARGCNEPGCPGRVAAYSKSGYCRDHYRIGQMLAKKGFRG